MQPFVVTWVAISMPSCVERLNSLRVRTRRCPCWDSELGFLGCLVLLWIFAEINLLFFSIRGA